MNTSTLESIGLTKGESSVYIALLEHGSLTTGPIAKFSGITNSKVYKILDRLSTKGLVSTILKGKIKHFQAAEPRRVLELLESQKQKVATKEQEFLKELPLLESIAKKARELSKVEVFEGYKGMKTVFDELLRTTKKGETMYSIGVPSAKGPIQRYFYHFYKEQGRKKFNIKAVFNQSAKSTANERKNNYNQFRYMPQEAITPTIITICKERTIINTRSESEAFFTIVITSKETANSFKSYFELVWQSAKPFTTKVRA